jgi:muramoyltetrapeptide carboxypeptidase
VGAPGDHNPERSGELVVPPPLRRGDVVAVVATSSPFEHVLAWRGLGVLAERYRLRFDRGLFAKRGYLAGDDARRADELRRALHDPDVRVILAARGGYGASRVVHDVDWSVLRANPRWIVGFSDVTALHAEASAVGVATMHASHVTALGRADLPLRSALFDALESPTAPRRHERLVTIRPGQARGPAFGGNLTVLHACAAAGRLVVPDGAVVVLEDVTERPYRIDRALSTLLRGGHFARVAGFALGDFTACDPGPDGVTVDEVLRERLGGLGVPVVAGLPVGHARRNEPVPLGLPARIDASASSASIVFAD